MRIGLLVNPIAGMGGRVGLKGTDGVVEEALKRGAEPVAAGRAADFLDALSQMRNVGRVEFNLLTCPDAMGEQVAKTSGLPFEVVEVAIAPETGPEDTRKCVVALYDAGVRLLVFVGGDGTARDILDAVNEHSLDDLHVLGVPSGVKMYSGIFVINPRDAAEVIRLVVQGSTSPTEFEIMDADEDAIRKDQFIIKLYGYIKGPAVPARFQGAKQASPETTNEQEAQEAIARYVMESMESDNWYILGPGTTVRAITDMLKVKKTTLGVDIYSKDSMHNDVNENDILELVTDFEKAWIIVSPIGHQGMLFGRGNQQISPKIIELVGKDRVLVVSTPSKLNGIEGGTLRVDTGSSQVDELLKGYIRVITDYNEIRLVKVV
jgi:predicted polyphosphate/ATP-dependent NAD kinase